MPDMPVPVMEDPAGIPKKDEVSAKKLTEFFKEHYHQGLSRRRPHARSWEMVRAIMHEIHYFAMRNGVLMPLAPDKTRRKIRAIAPVMKPKYRLELGRLNANHLGVTSTPRLGGSGNRYYMADRAQNIMEDWHTAERVQNTFDDGNQALLYYGMIGIHRYFDWFRRRACVNIIPQTKIMPIPYDATSWEEADGIMVLDIVTKQWLEAQDRKAEQAGHKNFRRMAKESSEGYVRDAIGGLGTSVFDFRGQTSSGALALNCYMKPTDKVPSGQWSLIINDTMYRYRSGFGEDGFSLALDNGTAEEPGIIPIEPVYYTKIPDDFYGYGFCEALIPTQREKNRQLSYVVRSTRDNKPIMGYDSTMINVSDITDEESLLVPVQSFLEGGKPPMFHFPAPGVNRDVGAVLSLVDQFADQSVNHESPLLIGEQSRRTEGGPATERLNVNAQAPLQPVIDRIWRAWQNTYPHILDMLKRVWPEERIIHASGKLNIAREFRVKREDVPWSSDVVLTPNPMVAGGRNAMLQLLFQLRSMPSDDGQGFELKSRELRRAMRHMHINPPGMTIIDEEEQRILDRIGLLINDGQTPAIQKTAMEGGAPQLQMENHRKAIELLKTVVLDTSFEFYGPAVKKALMDELEFHDNAMNPEHPDNFDDGIDRLDSLQSENYSNAAEQDMGGFEGQMAIDGIPLGLT